MAIANYGVWQAKATGNDANGAYFNAARAGNDYSQQDAAQLSLSDVVTTTSSATATSASGGFTAAMLGNGINIAGTVYEIVARASGTSITLDRAVTTGASGQSAKVGGRAATINFLTTNMLLTHTGWCVGAFTIASPVTLTNGSIEGWTGFFHLFGCAATPNDGGYATVTCSTGCSAFINSASGAWSIEGFDIDCAGVASYGIRTTAVYPGRLARCRVKGFTAIGFDHPFIFDCEVYSNGSGATVGATGLTRLEGCYFHDLTCKGTTSVNAYRNRFANLTGSTTDAIDTLGSFPCVAVGNSFYAIGRDCIATSGAYDITTIIECNLVDTARYLVCAGAGSSAGGGTSMTYSRSVRNNASYNLSGSGAPYNSGTPSTTDVALTAHPMTNPGSGDFSLNSAAGGGAACKGAGVYSQDIGAVQSQAAGGSPMVGGSPLIRVRGVT